jgi:hypothetical protein
MNFNDATSNAAMAIALASVDPDASLAYQQKATALARAQGAANYRVGRDIVPIYFINKHHLFSAWYAGRDEAEASHEAQQRRLNPRTLDDFVSLIESAEQEAANGCGQSDLLYERFLQEKCLAILDRTPEALLIEVKAAMKRVGFDPDPAPPSAECETSPAWDDDPRICSYSGLDWSCCPCARCCS